MIISQIIGGLGNQMFQYAAGRALSLERGIPLKLDISGFAGYGLHQGFELQRVFGIPIEAASEADVSAILGWQSTPLVRRLLSRTSMMALRRCGFVVEPHFHYWPELSFVPDNSYLVGYWQSEKYFHSASKTIRDDFTFLTPMSAENAEWADRIAQGNAISLHVRRGDYVADPKTQANHGVCAPEYYHTAVRLLSEQVESPEFFVFSDDISWVQANLHMEAPCHYISHNQGPESYNDMRLMSLCRHNIIANSSFSWWGAWLNRNPNKLVIAPKQWFQADHNTKDLIPPGWLLL